MSVISSTRDSHGIVFHEPDTYQTTNDKYDISSISPPKPDLFPPRNRIKDFKTRYMTFEYAVLLNIGGVIGSGIYGTLPDIYVASGSIGMTLVLWIIGAIIAMTGVSVYIEQATRMPRSGGEKQYLAFEYPKPAFLMSTIFSISLVLLIRPGGCAADAFLASSNIMEAVAPDISGLIRRVYTSLISTAILFIIGISFMLYEKHASIAINIITVLKILCLCIVIVFGWIEAGTPIDQGSSAIEQNFHGGLWSGTHTGLGAFYGIAVALYKINFSYEGWNFLLYSTNQLHFPIRNVQRASWWAVSITSILYIFTIFSFFLVVPKQVIALGDALFIRVVFYNISFIPKTISNWLAPLFVVISTIGSIACQTFVASTIVFETASDGLLPWSHTLVKQRSNGSKHFATLWHTCISIIYVWILGLLSDTTQAYYFIVNAASYSTSLFYLLSVIGLYLYIRRLYCSKNSSRCFTTMAAVPEERVYHSWHMTKIIFLLGCAFVIISPFFPPTDGITETPDAKILPYWLFPVFALIICFIAGIWYLIWVYWLKMPKESPAMKAFYKLFPREIERITTQIGGEDYYATGEIELPNNDLINIVGGMMNMSQNIKVELDETNEQDTGHYDTIQATTLAAGQLRYRGNRNQQNDLNENFTSSDFNNHINLNTHGMSNLMQLERIQEVHEEFARGAMLLNANHRKVDIEQNMNVLGWFNILSPFTGRNGTREKNSNSHQTEKEEEEEEKEKMSKIHSYENKNSVEFGTTPISRREESGISGGVTLQSETNLHKSLDVNEEDDEDLT